MFGSPLAAGVLGRARARGLVELSLHQLRDYAGGRHLQVDDTPYGGGHGMVMRPEPLVAAIEHVSEVDRPHRILLAPTGIPFSQERAGALALIARERDRRRALEDVLWGLVNAKEFLLRQ